MVRSINQGKVCHFFNKKSRLASVSEIRIWSFYNVIVETLARHLRLIFHDGGIYFLRNFIPQSLDFIFRRPEFAEIQPGGIILKLIISSHSRSDFEVNLRAA